MFSVNSREKHKGGQLILSSRAAHGCEIMARPRHPHGSLYHAKCGSKEFGHCLLLRRSGSPFPVYVLFGVFALTAKRLFLSVLLVSPMHPIRMLEYINLS